MSGGTKFSYKFILIYLFLKFKFNILLNNKIKIAESFQRHPSWSSFLIHSQEMGLHRNGKNMRIFRILLHISLEGVLEGTNTWKLTLVVRVKLTWVGVFFWGFFLTNSWGLTFFGWLFILKKLCQGPVGFMKNHPFHARYF